MPWWAWIILATLAGWIAPLQIGVNSALSERLQHPLQAAWVSFFGGFLLLSLLLVTTRLGWGPLTQPGWLLAQPWWVYTGGVLGTLFVTSSILVAPRLGATVFIILVVFGQMISSVALDQVGAFGYPAIAFTWQRGAGLLLILLGVWLVNKF